MEEKWKQWCRLCGKTGETNIDIFFKEEMFLNIAETINNLLSITIKIADELPMNICLECRQFVIDLRNFSENALNVQKMFLEIQVNKSVDLAELRFKYNLPGITFANSKSENLIKEDYDVDNNHFENVEVQIDEDLMSENTISSDHVGNEIKKEMSELVMITEDIFDADDKKEKNKSKSIKTKYKCELCNKSFTTKRGNTLHLKLKHSIKDIKETYSCTICDKMFFKIQNFTTHKKLHLPPEERKWYPCPHCDKKFAAFWYVSVHIRTIHKKEKSYICEECGKAFATSERLVAHKLVHTDEKPFQCPKCEKCFKCAPSLKHHVDSHEDTKYICSICGIQLNTKRILRRHMIVHSDKKKYKCNFCEKEFKRLDAFKHHLIIHTGLKPYHCPFCEQTFANGSNCRKHQKHSHSKELAIAEENGGRGNVFRNIPSMKQLKAANDEIVTDSNRIHSQKGF